MVERPSGFRARRAFSFFGLEDALGSQTVPIRFRLRRRADLSGKAGDRCRAFRERVLQADGVGTTASSVDRAPD
jgi:hypothetical protein